MNAPHEGFNEISSPSITILFDPFLTPSVTALN